MEYLCRDDMDIIDDGIYILNELLQCGHHHQNNNNNSDDDDDNKFNEYIQLILPHLSRTLIHSLSINPSTKRTQQHKHNDDDTNLFNVEEKNDCPLMASNYIHSSNNNNNTLIHSWKLRVTNIIFVKDHYKFQINIHIPLMNSSNNNIYNQHEYSIMRVYKRYSEILNFHHHTKSLHKFRCIKQGDDFFNKIPGYTHTHMYIYIYNTYTYR